MSGAAQAVLRGLGKKVGAPMLSMWGESVSKDIRGWPAVSRARESGPLIFALWHSRFLLLPFLYPKDRDVGILISPSADGDLIAAIIEALGRRAIRGSSRRGGPEARAELRTKLEAGWDVAIAVDGPTGPAYEVKSGVVTLALETGRPIVPLVYATSRGYGLKTWDRFWLPAPGSQGLFLWGEPQYVSPENSVQENCLRIQTTMRSLLVDAERWAGRDPQWLHL